MKFSELIRLLEENGFKIAKEKGSIRYYAKPGWDKLIRVDYHGSKDDRYLSCYPESGRDKNKKRVDKND